MNETIYAFLPSFAFGLVFGFILKKMLLALALSASLGCAAIYLLHSGDTTGWFVYLFPIALIVAIFSAALGRIAKEVQTAWFK